MPNRKVGLLGPTGEFTQAGGVRGPSFSSPDPLQRAAAFYCSLCGGSRTRHWSGYVYGSHARPIPARCSSSSGGSSLLCPPLCSRGPGRDSVEIVRGYGSIQPLRTKPFLSADSFSLCAAAPLPKYLSLLMSECLQVCEWGAAAQECTAVQGPGLLSGVMAGCCCPECCTPIFFFPPPPLFTFNSILFV